MKHSSVFIQVVRCCTAILVGVLLLPLAPGQGSQVAASIPGEALSPAQSSADEQAGARVPIWTRTLEPVVLTGSQLSLFSGVTLADLFVYAFDGSTWNVVPFQLDEVGVDSKFVPFEDGLLDDDDQLVFMAADLGLMATPYQWLDDADSKNYPRIEVHVTNPLNPVEEGWAYVYRSATLAPAFAPYVTWDSASNSIAAGTYIIGYAPAEHLGMDSLQLNGFGGDVLDRSKFRLSGDCLADGEWEHFDLTENSEEVIKSWDPPAIPGPVRVGGGVLNDQSWAYASMFEDRGRFRGGEVSQKCERLTYEIFRVSEDWGNPSLTGMAPMTYFESNAPTGVAIDGAYDSIPTTPLPLWRQVSGAKGSIVQVQDISAGESAIYNYYLDLKEGNSADTGDQQSYGDAGFRVVSPGETVLISVAHYVLDAFQINLGPVFRQYFTNPLQAAVTAQDFVDCLPSGVHFDWQPKPLYRDVETTLTAMVGGGVAPFTYAWTFGDDGSTDVGTSVAHTFAESGTIPVTLSVTNDCGTAAPVIQLLVWEPGTVLYHAYLPLIVK